MKRGFAFFILLIVFASMSCDDQLNPYGDFKERFVLNCILRGDTTFQVATLTRSYVSTDFDPYSATNDPTVKNSIIRIWNRDKVAVLKDTTIERPAESLYKTPYTVFYSNNFQPEAQSLLEIEAILPNGKRLTSTAKIPADIEIADIISDKVIPPVNKDFLKVQWLSSQKDAVFITRVAIYYFKHEGGVKTRNLAIVPINYVQFNDEWIPNFPKPTSDFSYTVDMSTVNKAMELISNGDSIKERYEILSCIMEVLSLDENLSVYYNSTARSRDIYSVKLDETDFSNISGGYGIFGVYMRDYHVLRFTHAYIRSFGYTPGLTEPQ
ncbi:MAG: DUF4249 family protein [Melioribacteraceae bacterium]|nr:DUF4249 family protein [Melioribacteraceae bacterium]